MSGQNDIVFPWKIRFTFLREIAELLDDFFSFRVKNAYPMVDESSFNGPQCCGSFWIERSTGGTSLSFFH